MAYIKLSDKTDTGKGFITHEDRKRLSFSGHGDVFEVIGKDEDINEWVIRVNGSKYIFDSEALDEIKANEITALGKEILSLKNELVNRENKLKILKAG